MKNKFSAHLPKTTDRILEIWKTGIFVFDANTILNLYRYSDTSRSEFTQVLKELKERILLPEQAALEYFNNRLTEISDQAKSYTDAEKRIDELTSVLHKDRGHPFISKKSLDSLNNTMSAVKIELTKNRESLEAKIPKDDIMQSIADIFDNQISDEFTEEQLEEIFLDGEKRYEAEIPPGYKDGNKIKNPKNISDKRHNFGDLIIWKQTINHAKHVNLPVIFITDDGKEDWWVEKSGKLIGARPELFKEFSQETDNDILFYKSEQFLKYAKEHLNSKVSVETIEEIRFNSKNKENLNHLALYEEKRAREKRIENRYVNALNDLNPEPNVSSSHWESILKKIIRERPEVTPLALRSDIKGRLNGLSELYRAIELVEAKISEFDYDAAPRSEFNQLIMRRKALKNLIDAEVLEVENLTSGSNDILLPNSE